MPQDPEIAALLQDENRFEKENAAALERFVDRQLVEDGLYDLEANLALLKIYLIYPQECKVEYLQKVLVKAIMALPETHFLLCMYQIPEKYHKHEDILPICDLAQLLEFAKFRQFWADYKANKHAYSLNIVVGFVREVRRFILSVVTITYNCINKSDLAELVDMDVGSAELTAVIKDHGWTEDGPRVVLRRLADNEVAPTESRTQKTLTLDQLTKALGVTESVQGYAYCR
mmetsp:Transcript_36959/g.80799  ORF Transcript_36959/g.80799 Transcript_36959/m.80799 type:complete len:230 (+) Transcript_36959:58-747(+)|eukprot:CAMPEP_0204269346 /NCGR_PEP_ID=MMETSP0468-20130131/15913_1 /ASSEMBLY_ACC=CAM_ASM_000383 /TAXON_ID=2969 /ORGANISM="Oxyrrhis marina" /LENGTH=229 /DNA_ID=CAMNT_0051244721 /DNA_START=57 /DNA_END=746 /DNA_ORIENTATION=+